MSVPEAQWAAQRCSRDSSMPRTLAPVFSFMSEAYAALLWTDEAAKAGDDAADAAWFRVDAAEAGETLTLHFTGKEEFSAVLEKKTRPAIRGVRSAYRILDAGGLAFDHAKIIACAWEKFL